MASCRFSVAGVTRFYVPLLLQGFSQSLSYPMVAGLVTGGAHGVDSLTAFSQGLHILFMIGSLGAGLVTTGLVFAQTRRGYDDFRRLNALMMAVLIAMQLVAALPPFDRWIFSGLFALPPELAAEARFTLAAGAVMNVGFFLRNVPMAVLFNRLDSAKANYATAIRILVTLVGAAVFQHWGLTGTFWGLFTLAFGVWVETAITWAYARPYVRELGEFPHFELSSSPADASVAGQLRFTLPLSLGGFLLALSPLIIAAYVARTADAADMLAIHYMAIGIANPIAYTALKLQPVAVKFPPEYPGDRRLLWYTLAAGMALGLVPLAFALPSLGGWYFVNFQNLRPALLPTARLVIAFYAAIGVVQALRAYAEGVAAAHGRSGVVMVGEVVYTLAVFGICAALLPTGLAGWALAAVALTLAPLAMASAVFVALRFGHGRRGTQV